MTNDQLIELNILPFLTKETCVLLNQNSSDLKDVSWNINESNVDAGFSEIAKKYCEIAYEQLGFSNLFTLSVDTPDLLLKFSDKNESVFKKIELKSTKSKSGKMPGSMIMKLDPNIWTIICKRNSSNDLFDIRYGRYFMGMEVTSHEKFQDRSPRPNIIFNKFQKFTEPPKTLMIEKNSSFWKLYAEAAINRVLNPANYSWQDDLVIEIIRKVIENPDKFKGI